GEDRAGGLRATDHRRRSIPAFINCGSLIGHHGSLRTGGVDRDRSGDGEAQVTIRRIVGLVGPHVAGALRSAVRALVAALIALRTLPCHRTRINGWTAIEQGDGLSGTTVIL